MMIYKHLQQIVPNLQEAKVYNIYEIRATFDCEEMNRLMVYSNV